MPVAFEYDAFISYTTADVAWAARLADDLRSSNLKIFFAPDSIRAGIQWQPSLGENLQKSQHLIVLSSTAIQKSDFVGYEIATFVTELVRVDVDTARKANRRIIEVQLNSDYKPLAEYQSVMELRDAGAYDAGPGWIDTNPGPWQALVQEISESLRATAEGTPITAAVLAMTLPEVQALIAQGGMPPGPVRIDAMLTQLELNPALLDQFYGTRRHDWKPFGNMVNVESVVDDMRVALEQKAAEKFRIEYVRDAALFSGEPEQIRAEAAKLGRGLALLVIDPISLYDFNLRYVLDFLDPCFENPHAAVMLLTPFALSNRSSSLRRMIERMAVRIYDKFYQPPLTPSEAYANYNLLTSDVSDVRRTMLSVLRDYRLRRTGAAAAQNEYLGTGGVRAP